MTPIELENGAPPAPATMSYQKQALVRWILQVPWEHAQDLEDWMKGAGITPKSRSGYPGGLYFVTAENLQVIENGEITLDAKPKEEQKEPAFLRKVQD